MSQPTPFKLKALPMMLLGVMTVALSGCNDNDEDIPPQALLQNSPIINEPQIAVGTKTLATHYAKLGPLSNATVRVYDPIDPSNALATGTTNSTGGFSLTTSQTMPQLRPLILEIEGGLDTDPDDNPNTANTPIENKGKLHAIVFASDLLGSRSVIVSPVTEIVYQRLQGMIGLLSPDELRQKLNDISTQLLSADITGNNLTDYTDILAFDPSNSEMHNKLFVSFDKYHQSLSKGKSFIEALRNNDPLTSQYSAELLGANAPNIDLPETNVADNVKLNIYLNGNGTLESALFKTGQRRHSDGMYQIAVPRANRELYALKVTPDAAHKVVSWIGCNSISEDQKTCLIKPDQSKSVYAVLEGKTVFKPDVKGHFEVPTTADVVISDSAGVMTISTKNAQLGANLLKLPTGIIISLPYLPHPLIRVEQIVSSTSVATGSELRFKFKDVKLTDILDQATFYSTPSKKAQIGLDDVVSVTVVNDKNIVRDSKVNLTDSRVKEAIPQTNSQTPIAPKYQDKSGGNHIVNKAWELVIHKDRCVIYADDTPPTTRPTLPSDPKNDTVWTAALRAAEGECNNKPLVYKPYKDYVRDFELTGLAANSTTNANHARFANMRYMQHMDKKSLANTPLYLISGTQKGGEKMRTAAAWTWAEGLGPVLKVRKNMFLARKTDGRSGFEFVSFENNHRPQGNLYNVSDFACLKGTKCKVSEATLPNMPTSKQVTQNPWYFGPSDPLPSPYQRAAVDVDNLLPLFGKDGISVDLPFKNSPLSVGIKTQVGVGISADYLWKFSVLDAEAAFKFVPEIAIEPRVEMNLKASRSIGKDQLEVPLISINLAYAAIGPVASIIRPELSLNAGIEFGGEGTIYAAYTRGMKASFGVDAYYNADFYASTFETKVTKHLKFPSSFETYKSVFEYGVEGQFYTEPYLELRLQGSVTGVADNIANLALRGFINASAGFEAGAAVPQTINKSESQVRTDVQRIYNAYKMGVIQRLYADKECQFYIFDAAGCKTKAQKTIGAFNSVETAEKELNDKGYNFADANDEQRKASSDDIHRLYDKNYSAEFVNKIIDGTHNAASRLSCRIGLKFGLDAGVRATANINLKNIEFIGGFFDNTSLTLFEQRWPIQLDIIDKLNEKAIECEDLDVPPVTNIEKNGTQSIQWKENINNNTNSQYALIECGSWQECQKQAETAGARLAVINNFQENQWISDNVITNKGKAAWIGLNSYTPENYYTWASGEAFNYNNWSNIPSDNNKNGVAMLVGGKWSSDTVVTRAIIEKPTATTSPEMTWKNNPTTSSDYALVRCGTWKQCDLLAKTVKARLVSIGNASENQWIVNNILQNNQAWIGLNDINKEGEFKWTVNESTTYNNWNDGEPNDVNNEDVAVILGNGKWNDASINETSIQYAVFEKAGRVAWKYYQGSKLEASAYLLIECDTWQDCQNAATLVDSEAHLANITSPVENKWIVDNILAGKNAWIGLNDVEKEGQYRWTKDNSYFYSNWAAGEPNNYNDEDYAIIKSDGLWNDASGNTKIGYAVIEKKTNGYYADPTWIKNPATGNEYALVDCYSWTECAGTAQKLNANLVTIRNEAENQWIKTALNGQPAFIGLNRKGAVNHTWLSLEEATYRKWASNQPNSATTQDVVFINQHGEWQSNSDYNASPIVGRVLLEKGKNVSVSSPIEWKNNPNNKHRYARVECGTWRQCYTKASVAGAYLAIITSLDEHEFVKQFASENNAWLGYSDVDKDYTYKWVDGNEVFGAGSFSNSRDSRDIFGADAGYMAPGGLWEHALLNSPKVTAAIFEQDGTTVIPSPSPEGEKSTTESPVKWQANPTNSTEYTLTTCDTWNQCKGKATALKARLATIANADINKWLVDNILQGKSAWIGLNDIDTESVYKWSSKAAYGYQNWNNGEPNNYDNREDVVSMLANGKWNDESFSAVIGYAVLERDIAQAVNPVAWKQNGNSEYALITCDSWQKCQLQAVTMNANLVTISSDAENNWVTTNILNSKPAWIGLNDTHTEGRYNWTNYMDYKPYTKWNSDEPNNYNDEDVVAILPNGGWNDESVNTNLGQAIIERRFIDWKINPANDHSYAEIPCDSWTSCQAEAKKLGGDLVTINDGAEQNWLANTFHAPRYWIGLTDKDKEGDWKWISGQTTTAFFYTNWNYQEPNNYNKEEHYAEMVENKKWNDSTNTGNYSAKRAIIERE